MLDRTVAYYHIHMHCTQTRAQEVLPPTLPDGYQLILYQPGMGVDWADIVTEAGLFSDLGAAMSYFNREFLPYMAQLKKRMWFLLDERAIPVATTSSWYAQLNGERHGLIHWVAARPLAQGRGLGRAIVQQAIAAFQELEPGCPLCLDTNTQSWHAICLYQSFGFRSVYLPKEPEELKKACEVLRGVMPKDRLATLALPLRDFALE